MKHELDRAIDVDVVRDIVLDECEIVARDMRHVCNVPGEKVVDPNDRAAFVEERVREMGSDKTGRPGDDDAARSSTHDCASTHVCGRRL